MTLAARQQDIVTAKNVTSRRSTTPLAIASKWVRNDSEATASTTGGGAQPREASSTIGSPESSRAKQPATPRMNATTALRVSADMQEPTARKAPAISRLPRYPVRIAPLSG